MPAVLKGVTVQHFASYRRCEWLATACRRAPIRRRCDAQRPWGYAEQPSMKTIKTYSTTVEADLARLALEAAGIPSTVVGISAGMEGGVAGVQLLVPDDRVEAALIVLKDA